MALTRTLADVVGRKGIRIHTVSPAKVRTEMTDALAVRVLGGGDQQVVDHVLVVVQVVLLELQVVDTVVLFDDMLLVRDVGAV
ncbi:hypothetical protein PUR61_16180, partial [Streptomyces sp. BE20]|uniref:hypothetical protein n=1 Tax=Streptomyces sp. BE20 TaxID=3002525 RepID=UPI002E7CD0E6|nr:hypothetical protein [Streptomyces sp. BE20]